MRYVGRFKSLFAMLVLAAVLSLVAACGSDPTATPTQAAQATPTEGASMEPWEQEWEALIEEAKAEGGEVVIAMGGAASRNFAPLFEDFASEFPGLRVVPDSGRGSLQVEKYATEKAAGVTTGDLWMTGVTSADDARDAEITGPFPQDWLILPEVTDLSLWLDNKLWFSDPARNGNLAYCASPSPQFAYNTDLVDPSELDSYWDLIDGRFHGQIVGTLPWEPGQTNSEFYINAPELGEEFIRKVLHPDTGIEWVADGQQGVDLLANGAKKIMMYQGNSNADIDELEAQGLPVKNHFGQGFAEGGVVSVGGTCGFSVFEEPAHPAVSQVFVNWWLSKDVSYKRQGITSDQSLRTDLDTDNMIDTYVRPPEYFFPEMRDDIDQDAGINFNRQVAEEYGLR